FNRLRSQVFMFYLFSALFALLALAHALHVNDDFIFYAPLARAAQVNNLWPLFPGAFVAYHLRGFGATTREDVLRVRGGIVDEYRLRAIHLDRADAVQVRFTSRAALAVTR